MPVTGTPSPGSSPSRKDVRKMLILFAFFGIAGVFLLAVSVVLGIIVLVVAEAFFLMAYRAFAKRSPSAP
jgi:4-hydroxybenzoate polyprenyltransferase